MRNAIESPKVQESVHGTGLEENESVFFRTIVSKYLSAMLHGIAGDGRL